MRSYPFNCVGCHPIHTLIAGYIPYIHLYTIYPVIYTFLIIIMVYLPNKQPFKGPFFKELTFSTRKWKFPTWNGWSEDGPSRWYLTNGAVDGSFEIRCENQLRLVVYHSIYRGFQKHPRWLFGIFLPSTVGSMETRYIYLHENENNQPFM